MRPPRAPAPARPALARVLALATGRGEEDFVGHGPIITLGIGAYCAGRDCPRCAVAARPHALFEWRRSAPELWEALLADGLVPPPPPEAPRAWACACYASQRMSASCPRCGCACPGRLRFLAPCLGCGASPGLRGEPWSLDFAVAWASLGPGIALAESTARTAAEALLPFRHPPAVVWHLVRGPLESGKLLSMLGRPKSSVWSDGRTSWGRRRSAPNRPVADAWSSGTPLLRLHQSLLELPKNAFVLACPALDGGG